MQGPIGVFVHHNTLHAFEDLPFEQAVIEASHLFGAEPYMTEAAYRAELARGRIQPEDIDAVLESEPDAAVFSALEPALASPSHDHAGCAGVRRRHHPVADRAGRPGQRFSAASLAGLVRRLFCPSGRP